ncbi:MAG: 30S ribosome-binding factor RbfA [Lachnospiraceae bacterium]|nr:30S ribosome-binding factor RbfA [Lachnospiraceae bacterium]
MRKNSIKNRRIDGEVQRVIAEAIRELKDPRVSPMTTVMETQVAPDLKTCKVWVSVMGSDKEKQDTLEGLENASGHIRSVLAHEINLRYTPQLYFRLDDTVQYAIDIGRKIDEVIAMDEASHNNTEGN